MKRTVIFDLSTEGLDPFKHRVIGITTKMFNHERIFTSRDEREILDRFMRYLKVKECNRLVGFNSDQFDIPFLLIRCIKLGVPTQNLKDMSLDLRKRIFGKDKQKGSLKDFEELLGLEFPKNGYAKMHMSLLWEIDNIPPLKEILLRDVKITWHLYKNLKEAGIV